MKSLTLKDIFRCHLSGYLYFVYCIISIIWATLFCPVFVYGADMDLDDMRAMSLNELLQVKVSVPAAITKLTQAETPGSITTITAEDIKNTPSRNIYDLIEIYVPGAIWMNYEDGPQLGLRGSIVDRNYKYLLRVNGRVMNNKAHFGAKSELEQWDMSDIQRIEIVRGPGSVTYGPGAVAGVINIITHDAESADSFKFTAGYINKYSSRGISLSKGIKKDNYNMFLYGSITRTNGYMARHYLGTNNQEVGYIGEDIWPDQTPLDYFADYNDDPQLKLYADIDIYDQLRIWLRYTQEGSTWKGNEVKTDVEGNLINQQGVRDRQFTAALQYDEKIKDDLNLSVMFSIDSSDVERRKESTNHPDPDHALNKLLDFSETEIFFRSIANWQAKDWAEIAFGVEYSWDHFGKGWGDNKREMRLGEGGIIVSDPSSNAIFPDVNTSADRFGTELFVGNGWHTNTYSIFSEANLTLRPWLKTIISGRVDKNKYSDWLFSPRIAFISNFTEGKYLKLILQQSLRMSTAGQLYTLDQNNIDPDSEKLKGIELIYSCYCNDKISFNISTYWNELEVISWYSVTNATRMVGSLKLYGIEPEISYKWSYGKAGINYSLVKQSDWNLAQDVLSSGISYSQYNLPLRNSSAVQTGLGNDLNNWPNQSLKIFGQVDFSDSFTFHMDARILWDFQGAKDGLSALRSAVTGQPEQSAVEAAIQKALANGTYDYDLRLNASLSYKLKKNMTIYLFSQNLLGSNKNKRYAFDTGIDRASPHRIRFVEEPRTFGMRFEYKY